MIRKRIFPVFIVLMVMWFIIACMRVFGYLAGYYLSDYKRITTDKDYQEMLVLSHKIKKTDAEIFVFSTNDGRKFFLLRYFSYPKRVYWHEEGRYPRGVGEIYLNEF